MRYIAGIIIAFYWVMKTIQIDQGTVTIIKPESEFHLPEIEKEILECERVREILLDLSNLDYINSSLIGLLLKIRNSMPALFNKIRLVNPNVIVSEMLRMAQLDQFLEIRRIYPTAW